MAITLDLAKENQKVKVVDISGGWGIRQRLGCLGIHGNQVALGRGVARKVVVEVE